MANTRFNDKNLERILTIFKDHIKDDLKKCLTEGVVLKPFDEHVTLGDLNKNKEAIWSVLVNYGLLTIKNATGNHSDLYELSVPNISTGFYITKLILQWENRILTSEQALSGNYTTVPEDPKAFEQFHYRMKSEALERVRSSSKLRDAKVESKLASTAHILTATSTASHAAVSSKPSEVRYCDTTAPIDRPSPVPDASFGAFTPPTRASSSNLNFSGPSTKLKPVKEELDKSFGSTLSGLRVALR